MQAKQMSVRIRAMRRSSPKDDLSRHHSGRGGPACAYRHADRSLTGSKASVLVLVIWVVSMLTIMAVTIAGLVTGQMNFSKHFYRRVRVNWLTQAGVCQAIEELKKEKESSWYDSLKEGWVNNPHIFRTVSLGVGHFTVSHQYIEAKESGFIFYGASDEERKLNINTASRPVIRKLLEITADLSEAEARPLAAAIVDWRDKDNKPELGGAEDSYYRSLSNPYPCKNKKFDVLEELLLIRDLTPKIFSRIRSYVTIYGKGRVNINTTSQPVLMALGLTEALAEKVIQFRVGSDDLAGTPDDRVITRPGEIVSTINRLVSLAKEEKQALNNLYVANLITAASEYFLINVDGQLTGQGRKNIKCVVTRDGKVWRWIER